MNTLKLIFRGIAYTIVIWLVFILLLIFVILCIPFMFMIIPMGAFMYASNPELIVKEQEDA